MFGDSNDELERLAITNLGILCDFPSDNEDSEDKIGSAFSLNSSQLLYFFFNCN